ncbi:MAG: flagellar hook assembly protein FlgD [Plesiomonas shigelloides]
MSLARVQSSNQPSADEVMPQGVVSKNGVDPSKNDFMAMMVAQIRNQNPLNPMDGTQYLTQLGMMSAVSSLEGVKQDMANLNIGVNNVEMLQSTSLIGKSVLMQVNNALDIKDGQKLDGRIRLDHAADNVKVAVYDLHGKLVDTLSLGAQPAGLVKFNIDGDKLGSGKYKFEVLAENGNGAWSQNMLLAAKVQAVHISTDGITPNQLELAGLGKMSIYDMREVAESDSTPINAKSSSLPFPLSLI